MESNRRSRLAAAGRASIGKETRGRRKTTKKGRGTGRRPRPSPFLESVGTITDETGTRKRQSGPKRSTGAVAGLGSSVTVPNETPRSVLPTIRLPPPVEWTPGLCAHPVIRAIQGVFELAAGRNADVWSLSLLRSGLIRPGGPSRGQRWKAAEAVNEAATRRAVLDCKLREEWRQRTEETLLRALRPWLNAANADPLGTNADMSKPAFRMLQSADRKLDERMMRLLQADAALADDAVGEMDGHATEREMEEEEDAASAMGGRCLALATENVIVAAVTNPQGLSTLASVAPTTPATEAAEIADQREYAVRGPVGEDGEDSAEEDVEDEEERFGDANDDEELPKLPPQSRRMLPLSDAEQLGLSCAINGVIAHSGPILVETLEEHVDASRRMLEACIEGASLRMTKTERKELRRRFSEAMHEARQLQTVVTRVRIRRSRELEDEAEYGMRVAPAEAAALDAAEHRRAKLRLPPPSETPAVDERVRERATGIARSALQDALAAAEAAAERASSERKASKRAASAPVDEEEEEDGEFFNLSPRNTDEDRGLVAAHPNAALARTGGASSATSGYWGPRTGTAAGSRPGTQGPAYIVSWDEGQPLERLRTAGQKQMGGGREQGDEKLATSPRKGAATPYDESITPMSPRDDAYRTFTMMPESPQRPITAADQNMAPEQKQEDNRTKEEIAMDDAARRRVEALMRDEKEKRGGPRLPVTKDDREVAATTLQAIWRGVQGRRTAKSKHASERAAELATINAQRRLVRFVRERRRKREWQARLGSGDPHSITVALAEMHVRQRNGARAVTGANVRRMMADMEAAARKIQGMYRQRRAQDVAAWKRKSKHLRARKLLRGFFGDQLSGRTAHRWKGILRRSALVHAAYMRTEDALDDIEDESIVRLRKRFSDWESRTAKGIYGGRLPERWVEQQIPCEPKEVLQLAHAAKKADDASPERRRQVLEQKRAEGKSLIHEEPDNGAADLIIPSTGTAGGFGATSPLALAAAAADGSHAAPKHPLLSLGSPALLGTLTARDVEALTFVAQSEARATRIPPHPRVRPRLIREGSVWYKVLYLYLRTGDVTPEHPLMARARSVKADRQDALEADIQTVKHRISDRKATLRAAHARALCDALDEDVDLLARRQGMKRARRARRRAIEDSAPARVEPFRIQRQEQQQQRATTAAVDGTDQAPTTKPATTTSNLEPYQVSTQARALLSRYGLSSSSSARASTARPPSSSVRPLESDDAVAAKSYEEILARTRERMNVLLANAIS